MKRDFNEWFSKFRRSIADYTYYTDFDKVIRNVEEIKIELNILNSLIGSKDIETDFKNIVTRYPETLKCIPILLAVRAREIAVTNINGQFLYRFDRMTYSIEQYQTFMRETGLFNLLQNHLVNNLTDYVLGVETGLDSHGRKKRGGDNMENLVESYLKNAGVEYYRQMKIGTIETKWGLDLSALSNGGTTEKRFDFVVKTESTVFAIETNFYTSQGSKLNETARSYKMLAEEAKRVPNFEFVWFTDGTGWNPARNNLQETFDVMEHLYSIADMEDGIMNKIFR